MKFTPYIIWGILLISLASAASFTEPKSGDTIKDSVLFTVKTVSSLTECKVTAESTMAGKSISVYLQKTEGNFILDNIDTTGLKDASDWVFKGSCYDVDGNTEPIEPLTGIIIDNTIPIVEQISDQQSNWETGDEWSFYCTAVNYATIKFNQESKEMRLVQGKCTFNSEDLAEGPYDVLVTFSDGKDSVEKFYKQVLLKRTRTAEHVDQVIKQELARQAEATSPQPKTDYWSFIIIAAVIILIAIIARKPGEE